MAEPTDEYLLIVVVALSLVLRMTAMLMRIGGHTLFMFPPLNSFLEQRAPHWRNKSIPAEAITETRDSPRHSVYGICPRCITSCVSLRTLPSTPRNHLIAGENRLYVRDWTITDAKTENW